MLLLFAFLVAAVSAEFLYGELNIVNRKGLESRLSQSEDGESLLPGWVWNGGMFESAKKEFLGKTPCGVGGCLLRYNIWWFC